MTVETSTNMIKDIDPATGETIAEIGSASTAEVREAVAAARGAQNGWGARTFEDRAALLRPGFERVAEHTEELARLITR